MRTNIRTKDIVLTPEINEYLSKKLESLQKFLKNFDQGLLMADIEIGKTTLGQQTGPVFRAEINLSLNGKLLRAESKGESLYAAIDEVRDELEREIKKTKAKQATLAIRGARSIKKKFNISPLARFRKKE